MFLEKQGQCPKCPKKLVDSLSFADHMAVEHRQVIDLLLNKPRYKE